MSKLSKISLVLLVFLFVNHLTAQDKPTTFDQEIPRSDQKITMVGIPDGKVVLGDSKSKQPDEVPRKEVQISSFYMSATEITHDIFMVFRDPDIDLDENNQPRTEGVTRPSAPYEDPVFGMGKTGYPAAGMTQFAALQFCKWLSEKTGRFYRLPTEAEWEYACRAGSTTPYFFGKKKKELSKYAWFEANSEGAFHKVGELKPNLWGLYDILGNVMEWTLDQYRADAYQTIEDGAKDPWIIPTDLHPRSVRGGSFKSEAKELRSAKRLESSLAWKKRDPQIPKSFWWNTDSPFTGFRVISPVLQPSLEEQNEFWALVLGG